MSTSTIYLERRIKPENHNMPPEPAAGRDFCLLQKVLGSGAGAMKARSSSLRVRVVTSFLNFAGKVKALF